MDAYFVSRAKTGLSQLTLRFAVLARARGLLLCFDLRQRLGGQWRRIPKDVPRYGEASRSPVAARLAFKLP